MVPQAGTVVIGSVALTPESRKIVRKNMAVCSQDSLLFARSIRDNIWYGNPEPADDEMILKALVDVGLRDWFNDYTDGLDTIIAGESQVSGGQAQRLQLARLFCKNTREYVFLDEACSALDSRNRNLILKHMMRFLAGKTCVWVTHHEVC